MHIGHQEDLGGKFDENRVLVSDMPGKNKGWKDQMVMVLDIPHSDKNRILALSDILCYNKEKDMRTLQEQNRVLS